MKTLINLYFRILSKLSPLTAGNQAFLLFQTTRKLKTKKREVEFYNTAHHFKIPYYLEDIDCFEIGDPTGKTVLLVHGWDSNAGSMAGIAYRLVEKGYHVVAFNLPAHGSSKLKRANLKICKEVFHAVVERLKPSDTFSVVAHSFGSAVTAYGLSTSRFRVDKLVFLTNPNKLSNIFNDFRIFIGLSLKAYHNLLESVQKLIGESVDSVSIENYSNRIKYNHLLLIHDYYDKILPYQNSVDVRSKWRNSSMITFHKIGHYRMLWNEEVIEEVTKFLEAKTIKLNSNDNLESMAS